MSRTKNQLTSTQRNPARFAKVVEAIDALGVANLVKTKRVGKTSIFKYKKLEPVNSRIERNILLAIKDAGGDPSLNNEALVNEVIKVTP